MKKKLEPLRSGEVIRIKRIAILLILLPHISRVTFWPAPTGHAAELPKGAQPAARLPTTPIGFTFIAAFAHLTYLEKKCQNIGSIRLQTQRLVRLLKDGAHARAMKLLLLLSGQIERYMAQTNLQLVELVPLSHPVVLNTTLFA